MKYCENTETRNDMTKITRYKQTLQIYLHVINKSLFGNPFRYPNGRSNSSHIRRNMSQSILLNPLLCRKMARCHGYIITRMVPCLFNTMEHSFQYDAASLGGIKFLAGTRVG